MRAGSAKSVVLALIVLSFPAILAVDLVATAWPMPTAVLYAIPVLAAARSFGRPTSMTVLALALAFGALDAFFEGPDPATAMVSLSSLGVIGLIGLLWGRAHERIAQLYDLERRHSAELEESRRHLLVFFSLVAHDLRGPLTTISGYSQLLARADALDDERRERFARAVSSATRSLVRLADDLMDASRIGGGRLELSRSTWDLRGLAAEIVEQRQVATPSHRLVLEASDDGVEGSWDRDRIARVLVNLIDNAVKYSAPGGTVVVHVGRGDGRASLTVRDRGLGIPPEEIPRLFQPYARARQVAGISGLGLGLYIVQGIVAAHGGAISVESRVGRGSTFVVTLPLGGTAPTNPAGATAGTGAAHDLNAARPDR
jgi:signal transduction histidine kinase